MSEPSQGVWWKSLLFGIFCLGLSVYLFYDFTQFEQEGGTRRMHSLLVGLYQLGGKWLASGFFVFIALICFLVAGKEWRESR